MHANVTDRHRYFDSRIELIDPESGDLLASTTQDLFFHRFIADDLMIASVLDEAGAPRVAVWRIWLDGA